MNSDYRATLTADDCEPKLVTDSSLNSKSSGEWMQALEAEYNSVTNSKT